MADAFQCPGPTERSESPRHYQRALVFHHLRLSCPCSPSGCIFPHSSIWHKATVLLRRQSLNTRRLDCRVGKLFCRSHSNRRLSHDQRWEGDRVDLRSPKFASVHLSQVNSGGTGTLSSLGSSQSQRSLQQSLALTRYWVLRRGRGIN